MRIIGWEEARKPFWRGHPERGGGGDQTEQVICIGGVRRGRGKRKIEGLEGRLP